MLIGEGSNKTVTKNSKEQSIQSEANHVYPNVKSPAFLRGSFFWRLIVTYDDIDIDILKQVIAVKVKLVSDQSIGTILDVSRDVP